MSAKKWSYLGSPTPGWAVALGWIPIYLYFPVIFYGNVIAQTLKVAISYSVITGILMIGLSVKLRSFQLMSFGVFMIFSYVIAVIALGGNY